MFILLSVFTGLKPNGILGFFFNGNFFLKPLFSCGLLSFFLFSGNWCKITQTHPHHLFNFYFLLLINLFIVNKYNLFSIFLKKIGQQISLSRRPFYLFTFWLWGVLILVFRKNVTKITMTPICNLNVCTLNIPCTDSRVRGFFFPPSLLPSLPSFPSLKTRPASTVTQCVCLFIYIYILNLCFLIFF